MSAVRTVRVGEATLHLGDCRDVIGTLTGVDAVVTDPPYGVGFTGKKTKHTISRPHSTYQDDAAYFDGEVLERIALALALFDRAAIFCGTAAMQAYPRARDVGGIICPNGGGMSPWGFGCYHPVLFYGRSPYQSAGLGGRPTARAMYHPGMHVTGEREGNEHPCPKPIAFMEWAVEVASLPNETILDPFMGSGTTGVACAGLGRKFIGIEVVPDYFATAVRRIEAAYRQGDLLRDVAPRPVAVTPDLFAPTEAAAP